MPRYFKVVEVDQATFVDATGETFKKGNEAQKGRNQ